MKLSTLLIPILFIAYAKSDEGLRLKYDLVKSKLSGLLQEKGLGVSEFLALNDDDIDDIIDIIRDHLELHCGQTETYHETPQSQPLMRTADYISEKCTPNELVYRFYSFSGTIFRFKLRASHDANIALSRDSFGSQPLYEVALGGWFNTKSIIRYNNIQEVGAHVGKTLEECEYIHFWIRWDAGFIQVGYEGDIKPFMSYNAPSFYKVNYIGIRTGLGSTGSWIF